jgi:DNA-binding NarL/FixJ family response regulator
MMMEEKSVRIIIVDDHRIFRIGLRAEIESMTIPVEIVGEAASAAEFFNILATTEADVVLLDIILPDVSGIDIVRRLRKENTTLKILMLSAETDSDTIAKLMQLGIDGFISKSVPAGTLQTAIEYVAAGAEYYGRDIARIVHCIRMSNREKDFSFTPREKEIIQLCAQGLSAKEIADKLCICLKTVVAHKYNIFKKMGISNCVELVNYALRLGIINLTD